MCVLLDQVIDGCARCFSCSTSSVFKAQNYCCLLFVVYFMYNYKAVDDEVVEKCLCWILKPVVFVV